MHHLFSTRIAAWKRGRLQLAAVASVLVLPACGDSGAGPPMAVTRPTAMPAAATRVEFSVTFPARPVTSGSNRRREFISPSIASLSFSIDGGTPAFLNAPTPTGMPQTVTTTVDANPGMRTFAIAEYDMANGLGNLLGKITEMSTVVLDQDNVLYFTLNGQLAKIAVELVPSAFVEGTIAGGVTLVGNQPQSFLAVPEDADGNTILSPGAVPALTATSASPSAIVAAASTGNAFTLAAPAPTANVSITVSGSNLDNMTITSSFNAAALAAFYIADFTVQKIHVFDENGTPLVLPATAFANLTNPMGLAYVPGTSGAPGSIVVTETSNFIYPYVLSFDQAGNAQTLSSTSFMGVSQPLFLGYGAGALFVPNSYNSTLSLFDSSGNSIPKAAGAFPMLAQPIATTYDADNNEVYVTNEGTDTIDAYTPAGVMMGSATTNSHPMGIAYDSNNKSLYVAYGGTDGDALDAPSVIEPQAAGITEFSEVPASVTNTGGFTNVSTASFFTGMAFDPYTKQIYAADAGMSKIDAFTEAGAAVTLPAGAFSTISSTQSPPSDPMAILFIP